MLTFDVKDMQGRIKEYLSDLEKWSKNSLSNYIVPGSPQQSHMEREQVLLQMQYWSTKILITRPCLCRTERRIKNESDRSARFNSEMAEICVNSARALTALFPGEPSPDFVYKTAPWWSIVHISRCYFMRTNQGLY